MRYRLFPGTDVKVSEIGFGTWTLSTGWWGEKTDEEAVELLRTALDNGVNFFDTADTYGNGRGEQQLAQAFRGKRNEVVYGTKIGYDIYDSAAQSARRGQSELPQKFDRDYMRFALDKCLERLETDHIDVLQLHNIKMEHVRDPAIWQALREMRDEGLIRVWGAAFGPAIGWLYEAVELCEREPDVGTIQMIWNILEQHPGTAMIDAAREHAPDCCFNIRVTHASGMLEGKYTEDTVFPPNDHRRHRPRSWLTNGIRKVRTLDLLTTQMTLGQAALKWLLAEPRVVTTLPNIYDLEQLAEFAAASEKPDLSPSQLERVTELAEQVTALIEIPSGSRNKYELDKQSGLLRLDRVLYSSMHYPGDYGFIPRTLHEDGDPLDILVRINEPTFPGCQIDCRPLGVLKMLDRGEPDDKILAVPCHDPYYHEYFDIADLSQHYLKEVEHFFHIYKDLEGRRVEIVGWEKSEVAARVINESIERYQERYHQVGT